MNLEVVWLKCQAQEKKSVSSATKKNEWNEKIKVHSLN